MAELPKTRTRKEERSNDESCVVVRTTRDSLVLWLAEGISEVIFSWLSENNKCHQAIKAPSKAKDKCTSMFLCISLR